jgi:hypothetical protein
MKVILTGDTLMTDVTIEVLRLESPKYRNLEHKTLTNKDGSPLRIRVNGKCKLWKTRPDEFRLPCKHGLKTCFYITESNAHEWRFTQ